MATIYKCDKCNKSTQEFGSVTMFNRLMHVRQFSEYKINNSNITFCKDCYDPIFKLIKKSIKSKS